MTKTPLAIVALACGSLSAQPAIAGRVLQALHIFGKGHDGRYPTGGFVSLGTNLFGTTEQGGRYRHGTVYRIDASSGVEHILYNFSGGTDGGSPRAGVTLESGSLFGTTLEGGMNSYGTVYKIDPATGHQVSIYSFKGGADGAFPLSGLVYRNGTFYGTTENGGAFGYGTVFAIDAQAGTERVVYSFKGGSDGSIPYATVTPVGNMLYGTTTGGGSASLGTVFGVDATTGAETVVHSFVSDLSYDGNRPQSTLLYNNGELYGTAPGGGVSGLGVVFAVDVKSKTERVIYSFKGGSQDGGTPYTGLTASPDGRLYGTTQGGLYTGAGRVFATLATVFVIDPATGLEHLIHNFGNGATGDQGYASQPELIIRNGAIYGTKRADSNLTCPNGKGCGIAFRLAN